MKIDLKRYKAIDVEQAAILLIHGHKIFNSSGNSYHIDKHTKVVWMTAGDLMGDTNLSVQELLTGEWFTKKPFDVRQAMLDRPNEWVGAYKDPQGNWHKVGFDIKRMVVVETYVCGSAEVDYSMPDVGFLSDQHIDNCIPIEDVPEEATR